ncbi:MAG TPA: SUF system NifU family Fe-S cluster assembly protein [Kiloniellaceae bacterium]|nr:SUF system NifU family Fe-S cluster assembly protein [Kiloniellaceae bacterium]
MLDDLRELYQEVILDHGKNPRNFGQPAHVDRRAEGYNPLCGDALTLYLVLEADGRIKEAAFDGKGCAISVASASLMTEILQGKTPAEAEALFETFHKMCTDESFDLLDLDLEKVDEEAIERLQVLAGVRQFPVRVKCATLAWHTLHAALAGDEQVSTE